MAMNLERDYKMFPLVKGEKISYRDLYHLYIENNLTSGQISDVLGISRDKVLYNLKLNNLKKSKEQISLSRSMQWKNSSEEYKSLRRANIKQAFKNWTTEERQDFKEKIKNQRHNSDPEVKRLRIEKFKKTWYSTSQDELQKRKLKRKQTYEAKSSEQLEDIKKRYCTTCIERYGVSNFSQSVEYKVNKHKFKEKEINTKRKNNSFNTSKPEERCYKKLLEKYPDTLTQYKSQVYPFYSDFYIPSLDLYLECNFHWTHGSHSFKRDEEDLTILNKWKEKSKNSKYFTAAVEVWTVRDVNKRKTAKENNLNWLEFFSEEEFDEWIKGVNNGLSKLW